MTRAFCTFLLFACGQPPEPRTVALQPQPTPPPEPAITSREPESARPEPSSAVSVETTEATIHSIQPGFRRCFDAVLQNDPKLRITMRLAIQIAPDGSVQQVVSTPVPAGLEECFVAVVKGATFAAPGGRGAMIVVPLTLVP